MNVVPFIDEGLGNSSYLIEGAEGEALLVDPDRRVDRYLRAAADRGLTIVAVLETHLHADFVSGAHELGARTGVPVLVPAGSAARFPHVPIEPDTRRVVAGLAIETIASPGHTPEHLSLLARGPQAPPLLFSGGALIVGGAARTDLIAPERTAALTRLQFETVRHAFAALPDETVLYPTHGGGSFCSSSSSGERTSTLGHERATNPVFGFDDPEAFGRWFRSTFPAVPSYFSRMRAINQAGPRLRSDIAPPPALNPAEFAAARDGGALIVDVRPAAAYMGEHIPGALTIRFREGYATWLGWLVALETPLLFVLGEAPLEAVLDESLLVGFEHFAGWLEGGMEAWRAAARPLATAEFVSAGRALDTVAKGAAVLDVRELDEFAAGHVQGAVHVPLGSLAAGLSTLSRDGPIVTHCAGADRAVSAVSILERAGFSSLLSVDGGYDALRTVAAGDGSATATAPGDRSAGTRGGAHTDP